MYFPPRNCSRKIVLICRCKHLSVQSLAAVMFYLRHFRWVIKNMWGHFKRDGGREWTQPLYLSAPSSRTHSRGSRRTEIRYSGGSLCTSLLGLFSPQLLEERSPWHFNPKTISFSETHGLFYMIWSSNQEFLNSHRCNLGRRNPSAGVYNLLCWILSGSERWNLKAVTHVKIFLR